MMQIVPYTSHFFNSNFRATSSCNVVDQNQLIGQIHFDIEGAIDPERGQHTLWGEVTLMKKGQKRIFTFEKTISTGQTLWLGSWTDLDVIGERWVNMAHEDTFFERLGLLSQEPLVQFIGARNGVTITTEYLTLNTSD